MTDSHPTTVVGIPTKGDFEGIKSTVESITNQTLLPSKLVICDASENETYRKIHKLLENSELNCVIVKQSGDGVASAYNEILETVCDDFDIFVTLQTNLTVESTWLENHVKCHLRMPEVGAVVPGSVEGREVKMAGNVGYFTMRNVSIKSAILKSLCGWDENFLRGEDWDFHIRMGCSDVKTVASHSVIHSWRDNRTDVDPAVTLSKYTRRPTSITFLYKYGLFYLKFHPAHVIHDALALANMGMIILISLVLILPGVNSFLFGIFLILPASFYVVGNIIWRRKITIQFLLESIKKLHYTPLAVACALLRIKHSNGWNYSGFYVDCSIRETSNLNKLIRLKY